MIARFHVGKLAFSKSYRYGPSTGRRTFREVACALGLVAGQPLADRQVLTMGSSTGGSSGPGSAGASPEPDRSWRRGGCGAIATPPVDVTSVAHVRYLVGPGYRRRVAA